MHVCVCVCVHVSECACVCVCVLVSECACVCFSIITEHLSSTIYTHVHIHIHIRNALLHMQNNPRYEADQTAIIFLPVKTDTAPKGVTLYSLCIHTSSLQLHSAYGCVCAGRVNVYTNTKCAYMPPLINSRSAYIFHIVQVDTSWNIAPHMGSWRDIPNPISISASLHLYFILS